jgi:hypothetical protein
VPLQGAVNPCLHASLLLAHYASYDSTGYDNRIPNGPHGCQGVYQSLEVEGKIRQSGQRRPEQTERGTKRHKGWPSTSTFRDLVEGTREPQALYLSFDREVSFTALHVGRHLAVQIFQIRVTQERCLKPPGLDSIWGRGPSTPVWCYGEVLALAASPPRAAIEAPL